MGIYYSQWKISLYSHTAEHKESNFFIGRFGWSGKEYGSNLALVPRNRHHRIAPLSQ